MPNTNDNGDDSDTERMSEEQTNAPIRTIIHPLNLRKGTRGSKPKYRYIVQRLMDYDGDDDYAPVVGMRRVSEEDNRKFKEMPTDHFDITFRDVQEILPNPETEFVSTPRMYMYFTFSKPIAVCEK